MFALIFLARPYLFLDALPLIGKVGGNVPSAVNRTLSLLADYANVRPGTWDKDVKGERRPELEEQIRQISGAEQADRVLGKPIFDLALEQWPHLRKVVRIAEDRYARGDARFFCACSHSITCGFSSGSTCNNVFAAVNNADIMICGSSFGAASVAACAQRMRSPRRKGDFLVWFRLVFRPTFAFCPFVQRPSSSPGAVRTAAAGKRSPSTASAGTPRATAATAAARAVLRAGCAALGKRRFVRRFLLVLAFFCLSLL